jgi:hypothetical protein
MVLPVCWSATEVTALWLWFGGCEKIQHFGSDWRAQPGLTSKLSTLKRHAPFAGRSFWRSWSIAVRVESRSGFRGGYTYPLSILPLLPTEIFAWFDLTSE